MTYLVEQRQILNLETHLKNSALPSSLIKNLISNFLHNLCVHLLANQENMSVSQNLVSCFRSYSGHWRDIMFLVQNLEKWENI